MSQFKFENRLSSPYNDINKYYYKQISDDLVTQLESFDCGNSAMNDFIKQKTLSYGYHFAKRLHTKVIFYEEEIIGYFSLCTSVIQVENECISKIQTFPAVEFSKIAISNKCQGNGIGSFIITDILKQCSALNDTCAVAYIIGWSVPERIKYYQKLGFEVYSSIFQKNLPDEFIINRESGIPDTQNLHFITQKLS